MKDKIINAIALAVVSIISAALVAYLNNPENRKLIKAKALKARKYAKKYAKQIEYQLK